MAADLKKNDQEPRKVNSDKSKVAVKTQTPKKAPPPAEQKASFYGSDGEDIEDLENKLK